MAGGWTCLRLLSPQCAVGVATAVLRFRAGHGVPCCDSATSHASFLPLPRAAARVTLKALPALADAIVGRSSAAVQHGVGAGGCRLAAQPQHARRRCADEVVCSFQVLWMPRVLPLLTLWWCVQQRSQAMPPSCRCPASTQVCVCCREASPTPWCPAMLLDAAAQPCSQMMLLRATYSRKPRRTP